MIKIKSLHKYIFWTEPKRVAIIYFLDRTSAARPARSRGTTALDSNRASGIPLTTFLYSGLLPAFILDFALVTKYVVYLFVLT
jgi:hypothetical protein